MKSSPLVVHSLLHAQLIVTGVHHIIHTASPVDFSLQTPQAFIEPAITGTTNILKSAAKYSPNTVKSAVITSSIAAAVNPSFPSNYVFTESDWNNESEAEIEEKGAEAPPFAWYCASKTAAEKAQWKWVDDKKVYTLLPYAKPRQ